jgi:RimJ/RimL family protein N-acetyltransferase
LATDAPPWLRPVTLAGAHASLVPLRHEHHDALCDAVRDGELWRLWVTQVPAPEAMAAEIARRLALQQAGQMLAFTVLDAAGRVVGMTTYLHPVPAHLRLEIGSTWYAASAQRTAVNTQCKRLLLAHAFEALQCVAVELRTHRLNAASRRAIERLGAQLDGVLRAHMIQPDGTLRDTAVYSITAPEWPAIRAHLDSQLARPPRAT